MNKRDYGNYFGYPQCCIDSFLTKKNRNKSQNKVKRMGSGFVPCRKHASDILNRKIVFQDIIINRKCKKPFPMG